MHLDQIWKYPVKSMLGSTVKSAELADHGIVGDRMWALRDEQRGAIASGRRVAGITRLGATSAAGDDGVSFDLPDGATVTSADADVNERLSAAIGHPVSLWSKQPASNTDHYQRGQPDNDDMLVEMREI